MILIGKSFAADKSVFVHCHFKNKEIPFIQGTFMNAEIELKTKSALVLPNDAVVNYSKKYYIFRKEDSLHYRMITITIGNSKNGTQKLLAKM